MVVRITKMNGTKPGVLKVDGLLEAADVDILHRECAASAGPTALDFSGLRSADARGVEAIRMLEAQGAELRGLCPYLELLVRSSRVNGKSNDQKGQMHL